MHSIGADFKVVVRSGALPREAPIRSDAANVESESCSWIRLRSANVFGAIERTRQVQMIVPHRVSAETRDILRQRTVYDSRCAR